MERRCSEPGCEARARARGLCERHYSRARRRVDFRPRTVKDNPVCEIEGCGRPRRALGLCAKHHHKHWRTGGAWPPAPRPKPPLVPLEVFMARQRAALASTGMRKRAGFYGGY